MTAVSRLTPRARPADQPRTASIVPPRASADGWDGAERPAHEAGLIACAARAADQLLPDPLAGRSCSRCSTGWCAAAPPAAPQRPCSHDCTQGCTIGAPLPDIGRPAAQSSEYAVWCMVAPPRRQPTATVAAADAAPRRKLHRRRRRRRRRRHIRHRRTPPVPLLLPPAHLRTCLPPVRTSGRCRRQCRCPCWLLRHRR